MQEELQALASKNAFLLSWNPMMNFLIGSMKPFNIPHMIAFIAKKSAQ